MLTQLRLALLTTVITLTPMTVGHALAEQLKVVSTFSILSDFAANVGGDRVAITTLVGPDGDAHVYEPRPADAVGMASADVILVNGLQFEGFLQRLVDASGTKAPVVEATKGAEVLKLSEEAHPHEEESEGDHAHEDHADEEEGHHHHVEFDPHAWQSVSNAEVYVKNIADAFCAADAAGCDTYRANAASYTEKLKALDQEVKDAVASIPEDKRVTITSHDAFGYFEHEYGIEFLAPEGVSTDSEASAADVAALIKQVREDKASAIFLENISNPRLIEQISAETGIRVGGTLYSDSLSTADGPASTYIDMMRHNIATIKAAVLGG
ncbi:zinc ABC transporter substrate-binding protein AztC [Oryzicola mucosus]|uniref:Metal ABC transporter substrate-binding protein n=1 Tax=Oryzicola mucosus TaxID=2767425 RepID=A0A8J6PXW9_9HYPH|nr:zinc ABC transporter substrate-binding protein AztC [Oryzicola mucosus]MBD0416363.1 metal ABC transporter substrate-binding protein [Oryzicola mucosus]